MKPSRACQLILRFSIFSESLPGTTRFGLVGVMTEDHLNPLMAMP